MDYLVSPSKELFDPLFQNGFHPNEPPVSSLLTRRANSRGHIGRGSMDGIYSAWSPTAEGGPRNIATCGFLPLPSITASPVCTPTSTISSHSPPADEGHAIFLESAEDATSVPAASSGQSPRVTSLLVTTPPTWVSTPPTPPQKLLRRSVTLTRPLTPFPPSASFPASTPSHVSAETDHSSKPYAPVPSASPRPRASSDPPARLTRLEYHANERASPVIASPLQVTFITPAMDRSKTSNRNTRSRPIFHIENEPCIDTDDTDGRLTKTPERTSGEFTKDGSWSEDGCDQSEKTKDDIRKYYALKELLATEVRYLLDLRALVTAGFPFDHLFPSVHLPCRYTFVLYLY
jgi:hypothetical protein